MCLGASAELEPLPVHHDSISSRVGVAPSHEAGPA